MNDFVTQMVCGARGFDIEDNGWVQLLVFVIMAVIYAVGSIAKAKKAKSEQGKETAGEEQDTRQIAEGRRIPHTPITAHKVTIRPVSATRTADKSDRRPAVIRAEVTKVQPAPIPMGKQIIELAKSSSEKDVLMPSEIPVPVYLDDILPDFSDPQNVRKAILHYEILGKPLSLRESPENI